MCFGNTSLLLVPRMLSWMFRCYFRFEIVLAYFWLDNLEM
ncbi:hypothetical protein LINPERHAP1_LOCUS8311 [Linum perenne]